jgi:hypothetical protein
LTKPKQFVRLYSHEKPEGSDNGRKALALFAAWGGNCFGWNDASDIGCALHDDGRKARL